MTKWDRPDDACSGPSRSSLEAAAEAAAKVNAMLIAKGKLKPSQLSTAPQTKPKANTGQNNLEMAEVDINDVPLSCRNLLTRGSTQDEISKMSGAAVSTRGRYMSPEERMHNTPGRERPLYLCVQGPTTESVDKAVNRIREIIMASYKNKAAKFSPRTPTAMSPVTRPRLPGMDVTGPVTTPPPLMSLNTQPTGIGIRPETSITLLQEKIFIGLEHAPPNFDVKNKVFGPGGMFLQHIQAETGAKVTLQGKGSGFADPASGRETLEPMHIIIQHPTLTGLQQAKQLAENLVQTVQQEYAQFQQALAALPPTIVTGTATILPGIQPQTLPPSGTTWTVPQPQHGLPASLSSGLPPGVTSVGEPQIAVLPSGEGRAVLSGGLTQQTVLVNTSIPPPNLPGQQHTSTPQSLPFGQMTSTFAVSQPPNLVHQSLGQPLSLPPGATPSQITIPVSQQCTTLTPSHMPVMSMGVQTPVSQPGLVHVGPGIPGHGILQTGLSQPVAIVTQTPVSLPTAVVPTMPGMQQLQAQPLGQIQPAPLIQHPVSIAQTVLQPGQVTLAGQPHIQHAHLQQPHGTPTLGMNAFSPGNLPPPGTAPIATVTPGTLTLGSMPLGTTPSSQAPTGQTYYKQYVHTPGETADTASLSEESTKEERPHKRRFTEEKKEEKLPENLLGYQHGPPHLANVLTQKGTSQRGSQSESERSESEQNGQNDTEHTKDDKLLMPPPPPPFNLLDDRVTGPTRKKLKGALGSVIAGAEENGTSDDGEGEVKSNLRQQQQEAGKYTFNQYSSKPQLYGQESGGPQISQQNIVHSVGHNITTTQFSSQAAVSLTAAQPAYENSAQAPVQSSSPSPGNHQQLQASHYNYPAGSHASSPTSQMEIYRAPAMSVGQVISQPATTLAQYSLSYSVAPAASSVYTVTRVSVPVTSQPQYSEAQPLYSHSQPVSAPQQQVVQQVVQQAVAEQQAVSQQQQQQQQQQQAIQQQQQQQQIIQQQQQSQQMAHQPMSVHDQQQAAQQQQQQQTVQQQAQQQAQAQQQTIQLQPLSITEPPPPPPQQHLQSQHNQTGPPQQPQTEQHPVQTTIANTLPPPPPPPPEHFGGPPPPDQFYNGEYGPPFGGHPIHGDPYYGGPPPPPAPHYPPPYHYPGPGPHGPPGPPFGPNPGPYGDNIPPPPPPPGHYGPPPYW